MSVSCNWVNNWLLVGGEIKSYEDVAFLRIAGITHIINAMRDNKEQPWMERYKVKYLFNPTEDNGHTKPTAWFKPAIDFALKALEVPTNKIYVHCRGGSNRGPSLAYAILRARGFNECEAELAIRRVREVGLGYRLDAEKAIKELKY